MARLRDAVAWLGEHEPLPPVTVTVEVVAQLPRVTMVAALWAKDPEDIAVRVIGQWVQRSRILYEPPSWLEMLDGIVMDDRLDPGTVQLRTAAALTDPEPYPIDLDDPEARQRAHQLLNAYEGTGAGGKMNHAYADGHFRAHLERMYGMPLDLLRKRLGRA